MKRLRTALGTSRIGGFLFVTLSVVALATTAASAQTFTTLHTFQGTDGYDPWGRLILDAAGNLYGTTENGTTYFGGTAFKLTPQGVETVLYSFAANASDVGNPIGNLIADAAGNLYGTATLGEGGVGGVFKLTPPSNGTTSWTETVLATGLQIGANPNGPLIADAAGNLYGVTQSNTVFRVTPAGAATVLYTFTGCNQPGYIGPCGNSDGFSPFYAAGLVADAAGNLYGTTQFGGAFGWGTVYKLTPPLAGSNTWSETVLYSFTGGSDGAEPTSSLILDAEGNLYGTTFYGGSSGFGQNGSGTVFKVALSGTETTLYSFTGGNDGAHPASSVIRDAKGNLYGTTPFGGSSGYGLNGSGTVFELAPPLTGSTWSETVLHSFVGSDGAEPIAALTADSSGNLYGTTAGGGSTTGGTLFKIALPATFNGVPGQSNCYGQSTSFLAQEYGGIAHAAAALGYSSVAALQNAVTAYCGGN